MAGHYFLFHLWLKSEKYLAFVCIAVLLRNTPVCRVGDLALWRSHEQSQLKSLINSYAYRYMHYSKVVTVASDVIKTTS